MLIVVWQTYGAHLLRFLSAVDGRVRDGSRRKYCLARNLSGSVMVLSIVLLGWRTRRGPGKGSRDCLRSRHDQLGRPYLAQGGGRDHREGKGRSGAGYRFNAHCRGGGHSSCIIVGRYESVAHRTLWVRGAGDSRKSGLLALLP